MNLLDKLRAIEQQPKKEESAPVRQFTDCWLQIRERPLAEFPDASALNRATLMLMQQEDLPFPLDPGRILYLDTETTGFAGAGTVAFEIGLGRLTSSCFQITQLVMRDYPEEKFLLQRLRNAIENADVLCTFNGKTFDIPLLRDRFLMNRMDPSCLERPHLDLLHMARRIWKLRLGRCNLARLESLILGIARDHDLPGSEVPDRYFSYLKTGRFELLEDVLTHNEQDIASLCVLLNRMTLLYEHPEHIPFGEDLYGMGAALEAQKHPEEARRCWKLIKSGHMHAQGQARIAESWRRAGSREEACRVWKDMIDHHEGGEIPYIALAKHYEHIECDIPKALEMTERALVLLSEATLCDPASVQERRNAVQYRYDRLRRRQAGKG